MLKVSKIVAALVEAGIPLGVEIWAEGKKKAVDEKRAELERQYWAKASELIDKVGERTTGEPQPLPTALPTQEHQDDCPTCGKMSWDRDTKGKDPHYGYTVKEIAKNLALLQNHFTDYKCRECISKHLLLVEGYAEEGVPMTKDAKEKETFKKIIDWTQKSQGRTDYDGLLEESRQLRLELTGRDHAGHGHQPSA